MKWIGIMAPLVLLAILPTALAAPRQETSPATQRAVQKGTQWVIKAQNKDGSWGIDRGTSGDVTCTALACLALMSDGTTERGGGNQKTVQAINGGLEWLLKRARQMRGDIALSSSTLIQGKLGKNVHNFFATVFFTQIYGMRPGWVPKENLEEIKDILGKLVTVIVKTQEADGSWHKNTFGSLKATCMAWLALRSANSAGINVQKAPIEKTMKFIRNQYNPNTHFYEKSVNSGGYGGYQKIYATATCLRVLYAMGEGDQAPPKNSAERLLKFIMQEFKQQFLSVEGEDYLSSVMISQALLFEEGKLWNQWFPWIQKALIKKQSNDGSWTGTACISGRTFATTCSLITLQTPLRLLPLAEQ